MGTDSPYSLRRAAQPDSPAIRALIRRVQINPTGLDWRRFLVAVDHAGNLVACGQLKPHGGGIVELASIAVEDDHRGRGLARAIIEALLAEAPRPLYLTCRAALGPLYEKWGFVELTPAEMPLYYRRLSRVMSLIMGAVRSGDRLLVMRLM
jgi:N-acetylglutamate synthase-like GNAT family acetyltransferase